MTGVTVWSRGGVLSALVVIASGCGGGEVESSPADVAPVAGDLATDAPTPDWGQLRIVEHLDFAVAPYESWARFADAVTVANVERPGRVIYNTSDGARPAVPGGTAPDVMGYAFGLKQYELVILRNEENLKPRQSAVDGYIVPIQVDTEILQVDGALTGTSIVDGTDSKGVAFLIRLETLERSSHEFWVDAAIAYARELSTGQQKYEAAYFGEWLPYRNGVLRDPRSLRDDITLADIEQAVDNDALEGAGGEHPPAPPARVRTMGKVTMVPW